MIRPAQLDDLEALLAIEAAAFSTDRISRRSFRHLLSRGHAATLVDAADDGALRGYAMVLLSAVTPIARLYSIAVDAPYRKLGVGRELLHASEQAAQEHGCVSMRLEVRQDNARAQQLFLSAGYKPFGELADYYEDHMGALRCEKTLTPLPPPQLAPVPYLEQSLDFTCGPAALMMAMKALDPALPINRKLELRIWRESTTIFMTSGHGGCGPYGLALSAYQRGFDVEIYVNQDGALFVDSVRSEEKKEVIRLVQEDLLDQLAALPVPVHYGVLGVAELERLFDANGIPVVLISSWRLYGEKFPHWVVVTGFDDRFVYVHDPFVDYEHGETVTDSINMPILKREFERMARYGKAGQRAAVILRRRAAPLRQAV